MTTHVVQRVYGRLAAEYDERWASYVARSTSWAIETLQLRPGMRVLDAGCGTGQALRQLNGVDPGVQAVGIDVTHAMLRVASTQAPDALLSRGSIDALPLPEASFDAVISTSALHYVRDPIRTLREMHRVLVPGGQVVITDWCADYVTMRWLDRALRTVLQPMDPAHHRVLQTATLTTMLREIGFSVSSVERRKIDRFWGLMTVRATR